MKNFIYLVLGWTNIIVAISSRLNLGTKPNNYWQSDVLMIISGILLLLCIRKADK